MIVNWLKRGFKTTWTALAVSAALFGAGGEALAQTLYVANAGSNSVSIIRTAEGNATDTVAVGANPQSIAVSKDGTRAYTANASDNSVSVINTAAKSVIATIPVGTTPYSVAVSSDGSRVYVANYGSNSISIIATATNSVLATFATQWPGPMNLTVSPDGSQLWVVNFTSNWVSVYRTSDNSLANSIPTLQSPLHIALSSDGTFGYVSAGNSSKQAKIHTASLSVSSEPDLGYLHAIAISPDGLTAYGARYTSGTIVGFDTATHTLLPEITVGAAPHALTYSADGARLYVANYNGNSISVVDTVGRTVVATLPVGTNPSSIALYTPAAAPAPVPTLSEWALILLGLVLAGSAALVVQRRRGLV